MNFVKKTEWLLKNRVQTEIRHAGGADQWEVSFYMWKAREWVIRPEVIVIGLTFETVFEKALKLLSRGQFGRHYIECPDPINNKCIESWRGDLLADDYSWPEVLEEIV